MSAMPKNFSAIYESIRAKARPYIAILLFWPNATSIFWKDQYTIIPIIAKKTKKPPIFTNTIIGFAEGSVKPDMNESSIIPSISSIIAAPIIAVPTGPLSFPISLRVSTVMLTEVAVNITPTNAALKNTSLV